MKTKLMNQLLRRVIPAGITAGLACCSLHAEDKPVESPSKPQIEKPAKPAPVKVPFLGLALGSLDESLSAQLNLPEGVGVLVRAVMPGSPAASAGILKHDVLHYFNDQLLVNESQLQTLVRQAGIGTDVTLKLLRKGKEETVTVKLGEHEEREPADSMRGRPREPGEWPADQPRRYTPYMPPFGGRIFDVPLNSDGFANRVRELSERMRQLEGKPDEMRKEVQRFQKEIQEQADKAKDAAGKEGEKARRNSQEGRGNGTSNSRATTRIWKDDKGGIRVEVNANDDKEEGAGGAGTVTATADDKGNVTLSQTNSTRLAWSDGDGSGELLIENGKKKLTAKDKDGKEIFSGPVDTEEQLKSLPPGVRERLERIESKVKVEKREGKPAGDI